MKRLAWLVYRIVRGLVLLFYPRPTLEGLENLPEGPCVIVANHAQMNGPIVAELFIPGRHSIWCSAEMMRLKEVPAYAFRDFWSKKPASLRWFYRLLSYIIAPLSVCVFNNAHCIGVYRDARILGTLRETLKKLTQGERIVIFPEHEAHHNAILWDFQDGFVDIARLYARQAGKDLKFVPMYIAPALRRAIIGRPVLYDNDAEPAAERSRVCAALMDAVTEIAIAQPRHRVVPYPNVPKRQYPHNTLDEEAEHEKDRRKLS